MSVDGTDFRIAEPSPFDSGWYSFQFQGPGLRYEVALTIETGQIAWVHGPFAPGKYNDLAIFKAGLKHALDADEKVVSDGGYPDHRCVTPANLSPHTAGVFAVVRARHKTINERLKNFFVLHHKFRHHISLHSIFFHAFANLTYPMNDLNPLFSLSL